MWSLFSWIQHFTWEYRSCRRHRTIRQPITCNVCPWCMMCFARPGFIASESFKALFFYHFWHAWRDIRSTKFFLNVACKVHYHLARNNTLRKVFYMLMLLAATFGNLSEISLIWLKALDIWKIIKCWYYTIDILSTYIYMYDKL